MLILFAKYLIVASFCSRGWQESFGMMELEVVGFLCTSEDHLFVAFFIVRSWKFSLLSCSHSSMKFRPGVMLLKESRISSMSVEFSL